MQGESEDDDSKDNILEETEVEQLQSNLGKSTPAATPAEESPKLETEKKVTSIELTKMIKDQILDLERQQQEQLKKN